MGCECNSRFCTDCSQLDDLDGYLAERKRKSAAFRFWLTYYRLKRWLTR